MFCKWQFRHQYFHVIFLQGFQIFSIWLGETLVKLRNIKGHYVIHYKSNNIVSTAKKLNTLFAVSYHTLMPSTPLSLSLSTHTSVCLSNCHSVSMSVTQSVCLSICLSIYLSAHLTSCLSFFLSICLSVCLSVYMFVNHPSVCQSVWRLYSLFFSMCAIGLYHRCLQKHMAIDKEYN